VPSNTSRSLQVRGIRSTSGTTLTHTYDSPTDGRHLQMQFMRLFTTVPMIFYTGLWCIKLGFLLFFRRLGVRSIPSLNRWWWAVTGMTALCYFVCFATLPYYCTLVSFEVVFSAACATQGLSFISMKVNCALDIFTDCLSECNASTLEPHLTEDSHDHPLPHLTSHTYQHSTTGSALSHLFAGRHHHDFRDPKSRLDNSRC
jgi:hypothetical protein